MDGKKSLILFIAIIYMFGICIYFGYNWLSKLDFNNHSNPISSQNESDKQKEESYKTIEDPWTLNGIAHEYMGTKEYDKAIDYYNRQEYGVANQLFEKLGDYKDSKAYLPKCKKGIAKVHFL